VFHVKPVIAFVTAFFITLTAAAYPFVTERTIDGDTFVGIVETRPGLFERVTVRLDCYYAPELREDGGREAKAKLERFLDGGVTLKTEWKREKYGRLLAEPVRGDAGFCSTVAR
jgi:endonuclease YncB( thermonuclease family)